PEVREVGCLERKRHRYERRHRSEDDGQEDLAEGCVVASCGEEEAPRDEGRGEDQMEVLGLVNARRGGEVVRDPMEREVQGELGPEEREHPDDKRKRRDRLCTWTH